MVNFKKISVFWFFFASFLNIFLTKKMTLEGDISIRYLILNFSVAVYAQKVHEIRVKNIKLKIRLIPH